LPDRYQVDHLLPVDEIGSLHSPGVVDVEGGRVVWSGAAEKAPPRPEASIYRLKGLMMPGMVNIHAHTPMVLLRAAGEGLPVDRWLREVMWPREGRLEAEDVRWAMTLGAGELLSHGITTSVEMYFLGPEVAEAALTAGLRCLVTAPFIDDPQLSRLGTWEQQVEEAVALRDRFRDHQLITVGLGPHSAYTMSEAALRSIANRAVAEDMLIHIHVAEQEHEGDGVMAAHGCTVPAYLERIGLLEARVLAAHSVWLTNEDIALFASKGVGVAHCPVSNGKHASGIARVVEMRSAGISVAIATDGPASDNRLDLFEGMRTAIRLARLRAKDAGALGPSDAIRMVTREAAAAIGRTDLGSLEAGCRADMILIDINRSEFSPIVESSDLLTHLVWSGAPAAIDSVWVEGRKVVEQGSCLTVDVASAIAEVAARAKRLVEG
jgi:5-methylthioadenosine/S-adenosylhomocysteine deaminase